MTVASHGAWYIGPYSLLPAPHAPLYLRAADRLQAIPVSERELQVLRAMRGCRPLEEHLEHLVRNIAGAAADEYRALLERWIDAGVLRPAARLNPIVRREAAEPPQWVVGGATQHAAAWNAEHTAPGAEHLMTRLSRACSLSSGERELLRWALGGPAANGTLLAAAGGHALLIDSGAVPHFATFGSTDPGECDYTAPEAAPAVFYADPAELQAAARPAATPLPRLGELLRGHLPAVPSTAELTPELAARLEQPAPRILGVRLGAYGTIRADQPYHLVPESGSQERVMAVQRSGLRAQHTATVTLGVHPAETTVLALDCSVPLPPFMPWSRRLDSPFTELSTWLAPEALFADYPVAAGDAAMGGNVGAQPACFTDLEVGRYRLHRAEYDTLFVQAFVNSSLTSDPHQRWQQLIARFRELADLAPDAFRSYCRQIQTQHLTRIREEIEARIAAQREQRDSREPRPPELLLRRYQHTVIRELADPMAVLPAELRDAPGSVPDRLAPMQADYGRYAGLLELWPRLWEAAISRPRREQAAR